MNKLSRIVKAPGAILAVSVGLHRRAPPTPRRAQNGIMPPAGDGLVTIPQPERDCELGGDHPVRANEQRWSLADAEIPIEPFDERPQLGHLLGEPCELRLQRRDFGAGRAR